MIGDVLYGLKQWYRFRSGLPDCAFYHDLDCLSGLGDRLVDVWGAMAIAELHQTDARTGLLWERKGYKYQGFVGTYDTDLFEIANCVFVPHLPPGAFPQEKYHHESEKNDPCIIPLESGGRQILLREGKNWGNNCADKLHRDAACYELSPDIGIDRFVTCYRKAAQGTKPATRVAAVFPDDLGERVGVHVRLTDKIADDENEYEMTRDTWHAIEAAGLRYIDQCINDGEGLFVCSDDQQYRAKLVEQIRQRGGDVVEIDMNAAPTGLAGCGAVVDFFALTRCKRIVKMTKYSTFSIAAAIAGDRQLVHLAGAQGEGANRLDIWRNTLDVLDFFDR